MSGKPVQKLRVALAGNPNVGKSTLFNALTGMRQHTGNWPGKTVGTAVGTLRRDGTLLEFTDLPGTYSLTGKSEDEQIAAEAIEGGNFDCVVAVCDGSSLERSLILALRILAKRGRVVVCVNLMDEAARAGIQVDGQKLSAMLNAPVVLTAAGQGRGLAELVKAITGAVGEPPMENRKGRDNPVLAAEQIAAACTSVTSTPMTLRRGKVDRLLVSRWFGIPLMLLLLLVIVWLTVWGANYPSQLLEELFGRGYALLSRCLSGAPWWLRGIVADGLYATSARVISVMLPPMAIFFPLFTLLEDLGYLPRAAFVLDRPLERCGACGKQALTMCMGLGCNAAGVTGCRIIDSPRERTLAILTNAMVPCNGRFPTLIVLGSLFFPRVGAAGVVALCVVLGVAGAMGTSWILSRTALKGTPSRFLMEMPPFRRPRVGRILVRSILDRTGKIALRALKVAAPAGAVLWLLANTPWMGAAAELLDPIGKFLGMNGVILLGFCLSLPANELLLPVVLMALTSNGSLQSAAALDSALLLEAGWSWQTAVCTMVFTLFHWPCATTLMTIRRETGSVAKTAAAFLLPAALGAALCAIIHFVTDYI